MLEKPPAQKARVGDPNAMKPFAIAGIQMYLNHGSNIEAMRHRLDLTMHLYPWVEMVMFSELAVFGPMLQHAQPLPGHAEEAPFQQMARHHRIWLVNGSMYERHDGKIYNTTSIIGPDGEVARRYRKMFPFLPDWSRGSRRRAISSSPGISRASAASASSTATICGSRKSPASSLRQGGRSHHPSGHDPHHRPRCRYRG